MPALPSEYTSTATKNSMQSEVAAQASAASQAGLADYKCLVCLYLPGGIDSHNMIIPLDGQANTEYQFSRGAETRISPTELPVVSNASFASGGVGDNFRVHKFGNVPNWELFANNNAAAPGITLTNHALGTSPNWRLHPALINMHRYWNINQLAVIRNVGVLNKQNTTLNEYTLNPLGAIRPLDLMAHNIQQELWQAALLHRQFRDTGWFGRTMNLLQDYYNPNANVDFASFSTSGNRLQGFAYDDKVTNNVPPILAFNFVIRSAAVANESVNNSTLPRATGDIFKMHHDFLNSSQEYAEYTIPSSPHNIIYQAFREDYINSLNSQINLNDNYANTTVFDASSYSRAFANVRSTTVTDISTANQMTAALRAIDSAVRMKHKRQVIIITIGGWDNHSDLRGNQDPLLRRLDNAIGAFWAGIESMGLSNNVVMFTESEFSRTFRQNTARGTDHAWAGHSFVIGGSGILNKGLYGPEPDYRLNTRGGTRDIGGGGIFIPDISIEQYYATMLDWFGVPNDLLPLILPKLPLFTPQTLGFMKNTV